MAIHTWWQISAALSPLALLVEVCLCLEFGSQTAGDHSQCTFPATGLLPKIRAIRSQLPLWLLFLSAAMLLCHAIEGLYSLCISKSQRNTYFSKFLRSCCFIFIVLYLFISISYIIPFPIFPATNLVSPPPASMTVLAHSPTHSCLDTQAFLDSGSSRLHRTKGLRSQWCPIRQSSTTYPAGAMCATKCTLCLV